MCVLCLNWFTVELVKKTYHLLYVGHNGMQTRKVSKFNCIFWCISMIIDNVSCKWSFGECKITLNIVKNITDIYKSIVLEILIFNMQVYLYFHRKCSKLSCTKISALHDWSNLITQQRVSYFLFWNIHPELFSEIKFRLMSSTQHDFPRKTIRLSVLENNMIYTYRSDWTVIIIVVSITCPWACFHYFLTYTFSIWLYVCAMIERKL